MYQINKHIIKHFTFKFTLKVNLKVKKNTNKANKLSLLLFDLQAYHKYKVQLSNLLMPHKAI